MFDELIEELDAVRIAKSETLDTELSDSKEAEGEVLGKSFTVVKDGEEIEAVDGTELVKALIDRTEKSEKALGDLSVGLDKVLKALTETAKNQGDLIKSLTQEVTLLRGTGRGRKSTLVMAGGLVDEKKEPETMNGDDFMAKAMDAQRNNKITATEVSTAEIYIQKGLQVPPDLVRRVLS